MDRVNELLSQYKIPITLSLVGLVLVIGGTLSSNLINKPQKETFPEKSLVKNTSTDLKIDLSGAVKNPGVYSLSSDSRVEDAIKSAGGFADTANQEYISKRLNLSQKVSDGQKIYIPYKDEDVSSVGQVAGVSTEAKGKIGLNSASESEIDSLPGIGSVTSQKIITGRPYQDLADLVNKKIVSKAVYEKIKDLVDLN